MDQGCLYHLAGYILHFVIGKKHFKKIINGNDNYFLLKVLRKMSFFAVALVRKAVCVCDCLGISGSNDRTSSSPIYYVSRGQQT